MDEEDVKLPYQDAQTIEIGSVKNDGPRLGKVDVMDSKDRANKERVIFHPTKSTSNWWYIIEVTPCSAWMYEGYHVLITMASMEEIKEDIAESKVVEVVHDEPGVATRYYEMHAEDLENETEDIFLNESSI
ncbi:hypothetical protein L7F22_048023 [Adiantum nelumboides]|nr:hypothetical protein [Adiantum nelumboides]